LTAAHIAGVLSLTDAAALVAARGQLTQALPSGGTMVAIEASEDEMLTHLAGHPGRLALAAVNGPRATVVSGDHDAVAAVQAHSQARGRRPRRLRPSHAFHSPHMDGMLDAFGQVAEQLVFHPPAIPIVSTLTGDLATADELCTADYWVRQARHI